MPFLSIVNVSKRFGDIVALNSVSLDVEKGEILGVLGENGSGKSTLAKILYGVYTPDSGYISIDSDGLSRRVFFASPKDAISSGIVMISQRPQLIEELSVVDNIALFLGVSTSRARMMAKATLNKFGISLDIDRVVKSLSYTEKQLVELVKALSFKPRLLIVDEVTTYLPTDVKTKFYDTLKMFTSMGGSVIFITHKIPEALKVCDRIAVLRKGMLVGLFDKGEGIDLDTIRRAMFGLVNDYSAVPSTGVPKSKKSSDIILKVEDLIVIDDYGEKAVDNISIELHKGGILAVVGIAGNGQKELCEGIAGLRKAAKGRVVLDGEDITRLGTAKRVLKGLYYIPEDPFKDGVATDLTIAENIRLFSSWPLSSEELIDILEKMYVYPLIPTLKSYKLSGGNIQKISLSRLILSKPKCVIAYNPTRMLDEASSNYVRSLFERMSGEGVGILLVSEDIDEVIDIADEVAVISRGKIVEKLSAAESDLREKIERAMTIYG